MQHETHTHPRASAVVVATAALVAGTAWAVAPGRDVDRVAPASDTVQLLVEDVVESTRPRAEHAGHEIELETLKFFIEFNETDEDVGVQCVLGGEAYVVLRAFEPDGRRIVDLRPRASLRQQGMSDFFFESAEPTLDEVSMAEFLDRFPEGEYEFETITTDGIEQDGEADFTHAIPAGPEITYPREGDVVDPDALVVTWEPVTMTTAFNPPQVPVTIVGYQVIVTREDPLRIYSVDLPAGTTSVSVPPEFLDPGTE